VASERRFGRRRSAVGGVLERRQLALAGRPGGGAWTVWTMWTVWPMSRPAQILEG